MLFVKKNIQRITPLLLALLSSTFLVSCAPSNSGSLTAPELLDPVDHQTNEYTVERRDVYTLQTFETKVIPKLTELSFESSGILDRFQVSVGDHVEAGQVLATLSGTAEALAELHTQYEELLERHAKENRLTEIDIEIQQKYDSDTTRAELSYKQAKERQELEERQLLDRIAQAEKAVEAAEITAPAAGTIVSLAPLYSGDAIAYHSPVIALATEEECFVTCEYIPEKKIAADARVYAVIGANEYELTYVPYDPEVLATAIKEDTAISRFRIEGGTAGLIGQYAIIYRIMEKAKNAVCVPINSLYQEGESYYVYRIDQNLRTQVPVTVGIIGPMYAQITEGVEEGDVIYVKE